MMPLTQLFDPPSSTYTYVLADLQARVAVMIDPVAGQVQRDMALLESEGVSLLYVLETHTHADHITSAGTLTRLTGALAAAPSGCGIAPADRQLVDGDVLAFGGETLRALHTPGHTAG